jgi:hypothetical protein
MSWQTFQLGLPGYEYTFDVNPDAFDPTFMRLSADNVTLGGDLKERVFKTFMPTVTIKSGYLSKAFLDNLMSLLPQTYSFLSFRTRSGDWNMNLEPDISSSTTQVTLQNSSITKLDTALYNATGTGQITINGVYTSPAGTGTNFYTGGSYSSATNTITLGTAISSGPGLVYCSYSYSGWMVRMKAIKTPITGGRIDLFTYQIQLEGV